jgi:hypothetical protein
MSNINIGQPTDAIIFSPGKMAFKLGLVTGRVEPFLVGFRVPTESPAPLGLAALFPLPSCLAIVES